MEPYVIRQGDHLAYLAHKFGFDPQTVWNDSKNDKLRKARPDPNILCPGDILYIPVQVHTSHELKVGQTNEFVSDIPTIDVSVRFDGPRFASQPFRIAELPELQGATSGADGTIKVTVPVTLRVFTVGFPKSRRVFSCRVGHLDPIDTASGVIQRLQNLGYLNPRAALDSFDRSTVQDAVDAFLAANGPADSGDGSSTSDAGDDDQDSDDDSGDEDSDSDDQDTDDDQDSDDDSGDADSAPDDGGGRGKLDSHGLLDADTAKLLSDAHGS